MADKPRHILFIASWYPNRNKPALGNFIQQHARAASIENKVSVIYCSTEENLSPGKTEIVEKHSGNLSEFLVYYGKINSSFPVLSKLKKRNAYRKAMDAGIQSALYKNGKADIIHLHVIWPAAVALLPELEKMNLPLIISEHWSGYLPEDGNYKGFTLKNISKRIAEEAAHITVVSQRMADAMKAHGLGDSFSILANCVDTSVFYYKEKSESKDVKLLHVSMLVDREKNISGLLNVMQSLQGHPEISLEIIGDGPEKEKLEQLARQNGTLNKTVFFRGFATPLVIADAMQASDALVMFSNFEGMPVTIIEALCCGLPVIATKTGSIPNMVNETQGLLVKPGEEMSLKNAILRFSELKNSFDRKKISEEATSKYSFAAVGEELNHLYTMIAKKK
jgi:glycosyltransferase involved in cell wall biosynthesis